MCSVTSPRDDVVSRNVTESASKSESSGFNLDAESKQGNTVNFNLSNRSHSTPLNLALAVVAALAVILGIGAWTGSRMSGGMMGSGMVGGFSWMWISALLALGASVVLGWMIFGRR